MPLCFCTLKNQDSQEEKKEIALYHPKMAHRGPLPFGRHPKIPICGPCGLFSFSLLNCVITNIWMHKRRNVVARSAENCLATILLKIAWQLYFRSVPPPPWWIVRSLTRSWTDKGNSVNLLKIQSKAFLRRIESQIGISARVGTKASAGERTLNSFVAFRRKGLKFYLVPILWGSRVQWQLALAMEPFPKFLPPEIYWIVGRAKSKN